MPDRRDDPAAGAAMNAGLLSPALLDRTAALIAAARERGWRLACAESCTGGLVAAHLTEIAGSSAVFEYGFVTYANAAKTAMLGVPEGMLAAHGAVSEPVARAMAEGALVRAAADAAVAITGIAGPGGGSPDKPVGLVHFGLAVRGRDTIHLARRYGDLGRAVVRARAVEDAIALLEGAVSGT
jgi:nicotinamide-nucleotide amidase